MDVNLTMDGVNAARVRSQADSFNDALGRATGASQTLGRDDFLQILLTQLQNQDPTQPMEDKEFIAQMAQFSSLEQMTNVAQGFREMNALLSSNQALGLLGRTVEVNGATGPINGTVSAITTGGTPTVTVGGQDYELDRVLRIIQ